MRAQECASRALDLKPRLAEPHRIRAYAMYNLKRYEEAVSDCNRAIELYAGKFYAKVRVAHRAERSVKY
jgi:regulator of sirC expression with transglutaminase-like and TPR domain